MRAGYRVILGRFLSQAGFVALAFVALMVGMQPAFAQSTSIGSSATAASLKGSIGQRFTLACPAIDEVRNSIYGTNTYTADSPVCQAALHAGALKPGEAGTVVIEIGPDAKQYTGSTRNGVTSRGYGPYPSSYRFVGTELAAAPAGISAPSGQPAAAPADIAKPPQSTAPSGNNAADPTGGKALAKKLLASVAQAVKIWQSQARLTGQVHGAKLITTPGGLTAPPLAPDIESHLIGQGVAHDTAVKFAKGFSDAWQQWQVAFRVPGLPVYPGFAAWPGPQAPPTANVPFSVAQGNSPVVLSVSVLRSALLARFPGATPQEKQAIEAFATAAANNFNTWRTSTHFTKVMGSGPVPTFAPPAVSAGPVMVGNALMLPGGLVGSGFPAIGIP